MFDRRLSPITSHPCCTQPSTLQTSSSHRTVVGASWRRLYHQRRGHFLKSSISFPDNTRESPQFSRRYIASSTVAQYEPANQIHHKRRTLKYGRARRKWEAKQKEDDSFFSKLKKSVTANDDSDLQSTQRKAIESSQHQHQQQQQGEGQNTNKSNEATDPESNSKKSSTSEILFGAPMMGSNPIRDRYLRPKVKFPRTLSGWKTVLANTWKTYLWTFEGFLLPEKKRDEDGNVIVEPEQNGTDDDEDSNTTKDTLKDKATDAANQISHNVQKNLSTIQKTSPQILQMGQQLTGISTKEELKAWVGEQLKLGTECLSEFMKGYRVGRDDEVDKMLHEYFKDLDEKEPESAKVNNLQDSSSTGANGSDGNDISITGETKIRERRLWGRRERRRMKSMARDTPQISSLDMKSS